VLDAPTPDWFDACISQGFFRPLTNSLSNTAPGFSTISLTTVGTLSIGDDSRGQWRSIITVSAALNTQVLAALNAGADQQRRDRGFQHFFKFRTPVDLTDYRKWVGSSSSTSLNSDTPISLHCAMLRYSTVAGDTGFVPYTNDGSASAGTTGAVVASIAADTVYYMVNDVHANGNIDVYLSTTLAGLRSSSPVATLSSTLPGAANGMGQVLTAYNTNSVAQKQIHFGGFGYRLPF
jgi:hypothetical protein